MNQAEKTTTSAANEQVCSQTPTSIFFLKANVESMTLESSFEMFWAVAMSLD